MQPDPTDTAKLEKLLDELALPGFTRASSAGQSSENDQIDLTKDVLAEPQAVASTDLLQGTALDHSAEERPAVAQPAGNPYRWKWQQMMEMLARPHGEARNES